MATLRAAVDCEVCPSGSFSEVPHVFPCPVGWFGWLKCFGFTYSNKNPLSWWETFCWVFLFWGVCSVNIQEKTAYVMIIGG